MEIALDLKKRCVETEIRRLHDQAVLRCFEPNADVDDLEETIVFLKKALEQFDFPQLRSRYTALCGHTDARLVLYTAADGECRLRIDGFSVEGCRTGRSTKTE